MKKLIIVVSIIIVILIIAVAGFVIYKNLTRSQVNTSNSVIENSTQKQTAGWKTYGNEKYGFQVQYPSDALSPVLSPDLKGPTKYLAIFSIQREENRINGKVYANLLGANIMKTIDSDYKTILGLVGNQEKSIMVSGINGKRIDVIDKSEPGVNRTYMHIFIDKDGLTYDFNYVLVAGENNINDYNVFNQILSTFKFTTPTAVNKNVDEQLKINGIDYNFIFTDDSVKVKDGQINLLQEINIGKDAMDMAKFDLTNYKHQIITANNDVNYDGYKDLTVEIGNGYGGVNFFYNFYYFNPTTKKFVEVPELKNVCNPNVKYEQKEILSSCKDGSGYLDTIYQFGAAGYIIIKIPKIYRIDPASTSTGSLVSIFGNNFSGFEGDLNVWIENSSGIKGIIYGEKKFSDDTVIKFYIPASVCQQDNSYTGFPCSATLQLVPGNYKIYVNPWGTKSNIVNFKI